MKNPGHAWLLLVYQLPAKHSPARVKAWRRLQRIGAVALKNSAYVLPNRAEAREDFEWIKAEIIAIGGQALVLGADALDPATLQEITDLFRTARGQEFGSIREHAERLVDRSRSRAAKGSARRQLVQTLRRLRERFKEAEALDYFDAPNRDEAARVLDDLDRSVKGGPPMSAHPTAALDVTRYRGRVWLTRPRPGVDRMSSAWLIRRFIDAKAVFAFSEPAGSHPRMIPFDMFGAEFGHQGALCTFETIARRFKIGGPAVAWLGRIVHDLDLKEHTYDLPETAAVGRMVEGLRKMYNEDQTLLSHGMTMFEALYQSYGGPKRPAHSRSGRKGGPRRKAV
jgi:hypothetical protein